MNTLKFAGKLEVYRRMKSLTLAEIATPEQYEELYQILEPRAVTWGQVINVVTWALSIFAAGGLLLAISAVAMSWIRVVMQ